MTNPNPASDHGQLAAVQVRLSLAAPASVLVEPEPFEARRLPELPDEALPAMRHLATACNGAVYHGDRLNALIEAVRWLRVHPEHRAVLFGG